MNNKYALCREMLETPDIIRKFAPSAVEQFSKAIQKNTHLLFTGEGSSRIFPAKRNIADNMRNPGPKTIFTEGATQALEYNLDNCSVVGASNSGRTKEVVTLFNKLKIHSPHTPLLAVTAHGSTPLTDLADHSHILNCGDEKAVAATKSVVEQTLFNQALVESIRGGSLNGLKTLADQFEEVLETGIHEEWISSLSKASRIYFAGRNDGVAEELTLKINEITRKPSVYLEGTYVLHGIEEVMKAEEVLILIDPFESEYELYKKNIEEGVGMTVLAISSRQTPFKTMIIPENIDYKEYLQLAAGWKLMVETGLALGINLDKPERARKVGNEV